MERFVFSSNRSLKFGGICAMLALPILGGCGTPTTGPGETKSAALTGQVDNGTTSSSSGGSLSVTASRVNGDGSLTVVSSAPATVGTDGRYTVNLVADPSGSASAGATSQIVITAVNTTDSSIAGKSVIEGSFTGTTTYTASPINATSTSEANLLVAATASGQWSPNYSFAQLRALLGDAGVASLMGTTTDSTSAPAKAAAQVAIAALASWQSALIAQGISQADVTAAAQSILTTEGSLDTTLDAATGAAQVSAAANANFTAFIKAYTDSGANAQDLAYAATATTSVMTAYAANLSGTAQAMAQNRAASIQALLVASATSAQLQAMSANATIQGTVTAAGSMLQSQITASATAGAQAVTQVQQAWQQYQTTVMTAVDSTLALTAAMSAPVTTAITADVKTLSTATAGAQLTSQSSISAAANVEAQALLAFTTSGLTNQSTLTTLGASAAMATGYLNTVLDLDAAVSASGSAAP